MSNTVAFWISSSDLIIDNSNTFEKMIFNSLKLADADENKFNI